MSKSDSIAEVLIQRSVSAPHQRAYTFLSGNPLKETTITYQELDRRARSVAAYLQTIAKKGDRVLLLEKSGIAFLAAFFGCLYAGLIAIPGYPPRRGRSVPALEGMATDSEATVAFVNGEIIENVDTYLSQTPKLKSIQLVDYDSIDRSLGEDWAPDKFCADVPVYLQYTSGSTSLPKGVIVGQDNLACNLRMLKVACEFTADSVMVSWLPPHHDMGLVFGLLQPVYTGFHCVFMAPATFAQKPSRWLWAMSDHHGTHSAAPNFAYDLCVTTTTEESRKGLDLKNWRVALNGAEPVRALTIDRFTQTFEKNGFRRETFCPGYGLAEATLMVTLLSPKADSARCCLDTKALARNRIKEVPFDDPSGRVFVGCGPSPKDTFVAIVNPQSGTLCSDNEIGEIWVRGATVADGYWQNSNETKKTFGGHLVDTGKGNWLQTGDLGFVRSGELFVVGRVKDVIIIRGQNHWPQDIEFTVQESHPDLQANAGAAFAVDIDGEERLVVVQEAKRTALRGFSSKEIIDSVQAAVQLEHGVYLHKFCLVKPMAVSKTSSGKIMRGVMCQRFLDNDFDSVFYWEKETAAEQSPTRTDLGRSIAKPKAIVPAATVKEKYATLQTIIREVALNSLNLDSTHKLPVEDSLIEAGLDSVAAIQMSEQLGKQIGRALPPTLLFDQPTIKDLTDYLIDETGLSGEQ